MKEPCDLSRYYELNKEQMRETIEVPVSTPASFKMEGDVKVSINYDKLDPVFIISLFVIDVVYSIIS